MEINKVKISNILGIEALEFEPGKYTEITGKNGAGKSSVLDAIKLALKGSDYASFVRQGAKTGEVVIVLDDGIQISKSFGIDGKSSLMITDENGHFVPKPQSYIDKLIDMLSVNPVAWLTANTKDDKKKRTQALLEALPIKMPTEKLKEILNGSELKININMTGHPLDVIAMIHQMIYEERRDRNKTLKEKQASIKQWEETMVQLDFAPDELEAKVAELEAKRLEYESKKTEYQKIINNTKEQELEALRLRYEAEKNEIISKAEQSTSELQQTYEGKFNPLLEEISKYREQLKQSGAYLRTQEMVKQFTEECAKLQKESENMTETLGKLDSLKGNLFAELPVKGLAIRDGEIFRDDIPFDRLNTSQQVQIAVEIAKMRAADLGIICVDGLEKFDPETYEYFKQEAIASGLQLIVTRVGTGDLAINSVVV